MHIAVLVKQIPKFEEMELGLDGRLRRDGIEPEMNPYCRRAVSKAVELAAERAGSQVTVFTLGPAAADDTLREAIAWGLERGVEMPRRARERCRVRRLRHPRHRQDARRLRSLGKAPSISCSPAATRSTPTPDRSAPSWPSSSISRSSPAFGTCRSKERASTPAASTTTAGCRPRSSSRPWSRARSACASPRRSTRRAAPRCRPSSSAASRPRISAPARGAPTLRPRGSVR